MIRHGNDFFNGNDSGRSTADHAYNQMAWSASPPSSQIAAFFVGEGEGRWGANPATDSPPIMLKRIKQAQRRGAQVIVIDHRRGKTAKATGARWVGIRPGTDGALALSMIHVLIEKNLYDREVAETITWVPAETIREVARPR